jgi:hypothetical protein
MNSPSTAAYTLSPDKLSKVEDHFRIYLLEQTTPYYVNAFVRKHKDQIDRLRLPSV